MEPIFNRNHVLPNIGQVYMNMNACAGKPQCLHDVRVVYTDTRDQDTLLMSGRDLWNMAEYPRGMDLWNMAFTSVPRSFGAIIAPPI
jgi:hypothetical protein